ELRRGAAGAQPRRRWRVGMSFLLKLVLAALAAAACPLGYIFYEASLSSNNWIYYGNGAWGDGGVHGAPGPILGAGLPILIAVGTGLWAARRSRRKPD